MRSLMAMCRRFASLSARHRAASGGARAAGALPGLLAWGASDAAGSAALHDAHPYLCKLTWQICSSAKRHADVSLVPILMCGAGLGLIRA